MAIAPSDFRSKVAACCKIIAAITISRKKYQGNFFDPYG